MTSVPQLQREVTQAIESGEFEHALEKIQRTVERLVYQPAFTARLFSSEVLDRLCQAIGRAALKEYGSATTARSDATVFVATHIYATGGHTAVLEDFIRLSGDGPKHVVFTGAARLWDRRAALRRFAGSGCTLWFAPRGSLSGKLKWLIGRLVEFAPRRLFLFNHHQDAVAIAAAQPGLAAETVFYHHGDHHLCLGVHLPHAVHVDFHPMGFHNCRSSLGIADNVYCPLTVRDLGTEVTRRVPGPDGLLSCTVANWNKIELEYPYPYREIVPEFLRRTGGRHLHIGKLSASVVHAIRKRMRALGLSPERFEMATGVRNVWSELLARGVGVYLCSFPYGGARAAVEVMGAGVPLIAHLHYRSPFLGAADATYPGSLRWRTPEQLWEIVRSLTPEVLADHARQAREHYETHHREELLGEFLSRGDLRRPLLESPPVKLYAPDMLQAALSDLESMKQRSLKPALLQAGRALQRVTSLFG